MTLDEATQQMNATYDACRRNANAKHDAKVAKIREQGYADESRVQIEITHLRNCHNTLLACIEQTRHRELCRLRKQYLPYDPSVNKWIIFAIIVAVIIAWLIGSGTMYLLGMLFTRITST